MRERERDGQSGDVCAVPRVRQACRNAWRQAGRHSQVLQGACVPVPKESAKIANVPYVVGSSGGEKMGRDIQLGLTTCRQPSSRFDGCTSCVRFELVTRPVVPAHARDHCVCGARWYVLDRLWSVLLETIYHVWTHGTHDHTRLATPIALESQGHTMTPLSDSGHLLRRGLLFSMTSPTSEEG